MGPSLEVNACLHKRVDMCAEMLQTPPVPDREVRSFCRFCAALCGIVVEVDGGEAVKVRGDPEHPFSRGYVCSKGRSLPEFTHGPDRLDRPEMGRGPARATVSWDACLDDLAARLRSVIDEHGPSAVGAYLGVASAFDAAGRHGATTFLDRLGSRSRYTSTSNDCPSKPIVTELMAGLSLISTIDEQHVTLTVLIGLNPVVSHGHTFGFADPVRRLRRLAADGRELWVLDPRRTETATLATRHLQLRPGTDHAVLAFLIRGLLADGGADRSFVDEHATGVDRLTAAVAPFTSSRTAALTGLDPRELADLGAALRRHGRLSVQTGTGATMSVAANATEWFARALEVVTGSADRTGGTLFNPGYAMALDAMGPLPTPISTRAPGPASRPELPSFSGELPVSAAIDEIDAGNLRALVVLGGNPVTSFPETPRLLAALDRLDVLAVADVATTDTTGLATHVLPCTGPLERADVPYIEMLYPGVATHYTPAVVAPAFARKPAWWIFASLAERLGTTILPEGMTSSSATDDDVLALQFGEGPRSFAAARAEQRCVVVGPPPPGWVTANVLPDGRWDVAPEELVEQLRGLPEPAPLMLVSRRQPRHLNSQLRTVATRGARRDEAVALLHPADAAEHGIGDGDGIEIATGVGSLVATARFDDRLRRGVLSLPHGWSGHLGPNVSELTSATRDVDPLTGMIRQTALPVTIAARR